MILWLLLALLFAVLAYELGPLAVALAIVLLPPRWDPAIRLKEKTDAQSKHQRERHRA